MNALRAAIAIALAPLVLALAWGVFDLLVALANGATVDVVPFWAGGAIYVLCHVLFPRPVLAYVFGHELTHAVAGLFSGARLKRFSVSARGGSVVLTKTNLLIALSPYFVPIYTVAVLTLYWITGRFWPVSGWHAWLLFAVGFTLAFHFALTRYALAQGQPDLRPFGTVFSGAVIIAVNCLVVAVILNLLFPAQVGLSGYVMQAGGRTVAAYRWIGNHAWQWYLTTR